MTSPRLPTPPPESEEPGLPGFHSWRAVYLFVIIVFVAIVSGLALLEGWLSG